MQRDLLSVDVVPRQVRPGSRMNLFFLFPSRSKPCCPTCSRPFEKDSEVEALLEDLESEIKKIPSKVQNLQAKLKRAVAKLDKLQSLFPDKKQSDELKREVGLSFALN